MWCIILAVHLGSFQLSLNQKKIHWQEHSTYTAKKRKRKKLKYRMKYSGEYWWNSPSMQQDYFNRQYLNTTYWILYFQIWDFKSWHVWNFLQRALYYEALLWLAASVTSLKTQQHMGLNLLCSQKWSCFVNRVSAHQPSLLSSLWVTWWVRIILNCLVSVHCLQSECSYLSRHGNTFVLGCIVENAICPPKMRDSSQL